MDPNQRKYHGQIEITDLIAEAVSNAAARRNQVLDSEEPLSSLSDEQAKSVTGGQILSISPITPGMWIIECD
jgi:hypothetical protein